MHRSLRKSIVIATALALSGCGGSSSVESAAFASPSRGSAQLPPPGAYALDPPHTFVYFSARHKMVGQVRGRFDTMTGTLVVDKDPAACSVDVSIEAASVDTQNTVRDADLRSASFFDAAHFPTITYRGRGIRRVANGWVVDGVLGIRGLTKVVPLTFEFAGTAPPEAKKPARVAFRGSAGTRRAEFGMVRELVEEIGENATGVDVTVEIDAEALATTKP